jgi:hypothetical protein
VKGAPRSGPRIPDPRSPGSPRPPAPPSRLISHPLVRRKPTPAPLSFSREARVRLPVLDDARTHPVTGRHVGRARSPFSRWRQRCAPRNLASRARRSARPQRCRPPTGPPAHGAAVQRLRERFPPLGHGQAPAPPPGGPHPGGGHGRAPPRPPHAAGPPGGTAAGTPAPARPPCPPLCGPHATGLHPPQPGDRVQIDTMPLRPLPGVVRSHVTAGDVVFRGNVLGVRARTSARTAHSFRAEVRERLPFPVRALPVDARPTSRLPVRPAGSPGTGCRPGLRRALAPAPGVLRLRRWGPGDPGPRRGERGKRGASASPAPGPGDQTPAASPWRPCRLPPVPEVLSQCVGLLPDACAV